MAKRVHKLKVCSSENYELINNKLIRVQKVSVFFVKTTRPYVMFLGKEIALNNDKEIKLFAKEGFNIIWK